MNFKNTYIMKIENEKHLIDDNYKEIDEIKPIIKEM